MFQHRQEMSMSALPVEPLISFAYDYTRRRHRGSVGFELDANYAKFKIAGQEPNDVIDGLTKWCAPECLWKSKIIKQVGGTSDCRCWIIEKTKCWRSLANPAASVDGNEQTTIRDRSLKKGPHRNVVYSFPTTEAAWPLSSSSSLFYLPQKKTLEIWYKRRKCWNNSAD